MSARPASSTAAPARSADPVVLTGNMQALQFIQALLFLAAGLATGVAGFRGWSGMVVYVFVTAALVGVMLLRSGGSLEDYFMQSPQSMFLSTVGGQLVPFLLFWSLGYSVVHVY